jgi:N-acetylglucosaminyl-diphospho-decaprenol L-rhamnosyltransferase
MQARPVEPLRLSGGGGRREAAGEEIAITTIVPTFNSTDEIHACLSSVRRWLPTAQTIVVDNGSLDGTPEKVRMAFPDTVVLAGHGNVGFGGACNLGAAHATGDYLLYLNPDAELVALDHEALLRETSSTRFGMLAASLREGQRSRPMLRRQSGRWLSEFVAAHLLAILSALAPKPRYVERADGPGVYTVSGAAFMVKAAEFRAVGGFDERFFMYYEDTDLTQRYRQLGYPLRATDALAIRHVGGTSAPAPRRNALSFLGWLEYLAKWQGPAAAGRAASVAKVSYSMVLGLLRQLAALGGGERVRAKAEEMATMLSHIAAAGEEVPGRRREAQSTARQPGTDSGAGAPALYPAAGPIAKDRFRSSGSDA